MACAKQRVECVIVGVDGQRWHGANDCAAPQPACPREPGEGYAKCVEVCRQDGHAEIMALRQAGEAARGGTAYVSGHVYVCDGCQSALRAAGVAWALT